MVSARPGRFILGRISHHVRRQDWIAVTIEFLVVVAGVFLGLQVSNWNEQRQQREDEQAILERLHEETGALLEVVRAEHEEQQSRTDRLVSAQPVIFSVEELRPLTPGECRAVVSSHVYRKPSDELPILDELIETGRFDRLQDYELRQMLRNYILFRDRQRAIHEERTNELFRLYSRYPDAIMVRLVTAEDQSDDGGVLQVLGDENYHWRANCDVAQMRENQAFLNDFFDNMGRNGNILDAYSEREDMLTSLNEHLGALQAF